jgi:hypothetical protein
MTRNTKASFSFLFALGLSFSFQSPTAQAATDLRQISKFVCTSVDEDTQIIVTYSQSSDQAMGPRAVEMSVLNPSISEPNRLTARFQQQTGLLNNSGSVVVGYVDLSSADSARRGRKIGGTVLGALHSIVLDIDISYAQQSLNGTNNRYAAQAVYLKTNGQKLTQDFECVGSLNH